jgi:hypothetical protein
MIDHRELLQRASAKVAPPERVMEGLVRRRNRRRTRQRLGAGVLALVLAAFPIGWVIHGFRSGGEQPPRQIGGQIGSPGDIEWSKTFATQDAPGVAADATGTYVIRTGEGLGAFGPLYPPYSLAKYDPNGDEQWTRPFGPRIELSAVAVGPAGVYVAGVAGYSVFVREFDPNGRIIRTQWFAVGESQGSPSLTLDSTGFYVAGYGEGRRGAPIQGAFVRKYSLNGTEVLWTRPLGRMLPTGIAASTAGVYLVGIPIRGQGALLERLDPSGTVLWVRDLPFVGVEVAADPTGVYVTGTAPDHTGSIHKYDAAGNDVWSQALGSSFAPYAVAADPRGVYVVGVANKTERSTSSFLSWGYDDDGALLWTRTIPFRPKPKSALGAAIALGSSSASVLAQSIPTYPQCFPRGGTCPAFSKQFIGRGGLTTISLGAVLPTAAAGARGGRIPNRIPYEPIAIVVVVLSVGVWLGKGAGRTRARSKLGS